MSAQGHPPTCSSPGEVLCAGDSGAEPSWVDRSWRDGEGCVWMGVEGTRWAKAWAKKNRLVVGGGEASGKLGEAGTSREGLGVGSPGWVGASWGRFGAAGGGDQSSGAAASQGPPRLPSPTVLSGCNEELFQLKAPGAWPAAAAALANLQQGPGEPSCPLTAWPGVS